MGLAVLGLFKAGAVVTLGVAIGLPTLLVSIAAALWVTGPVTVAILWGERQQRRARANEAVRS